MDQVVWKNEWLEVRITPDGWTYIHQARPEGVAVLAYKRNPMKIVGRFEPCPPHHDGIALASLTGQCDEGGEDPIEAAVRELYEEAGIRVSPNELENLGMVRPSKASDFKMHLYCVDIGDRDIGNAPGDGSKHEQQSYCKWVSPHNALLSKDPTLVTLVARGLLGRFGCPAGYLKKG